MSMFNDSITNQSDISHIIPNNNQSKEYYYCPKCSKIPNITFDGIYVTIECCGSKEPIKTQQNEDVTNLNILKEFAEYKKYKLLLKSYNKIVSDNGNTPKNCESKLNHSDDQKAKEYCADCDDPQLMCNNCITLHDKLNKKHKIKVKSNGMKISKFCEEEECKTKGIIMYYCNDCHYHICQGCKSLNHINHSITPLDSFYSEEQINIDSLYKVNNTFIKVKSAINKCKELIEKEELKINNISYFYQSLLNTYHCTKGIPNYQILNNLKNNKLENILSSSFQQLNNEIASNLYFSFQLSDIYINQINQLKDTITNLNNQIKQKNDQLNNTITNLNNQINKLKQNNEKLQDNKTNLNNQNTNHYQSLKNVYLFIIYLVCNINAILNNSLYIYNY